MHTHVCEECGTTYTPTRRDSFLCGSGCKSRRYRRNKAERLAREIAATTALLAALSARADLLPED